MKRLFSLRVLKKAILVPIMNTVVSSFCLQLYWRLDQLLVSSVYASNEDVPKRVFSSSGKNPGVQNIIFPGIYGFFP